MIASIADTSDDSKTLAALSPRVIFRTDWNSQDQVTLQYTPLVVRLRRRRPHGPARRRRSFRRARSEHVLADREHVVVTMTRRLLPLAFVARRRCRACGGTDDGRPSGEPAGRGPPLDPCKADDGYEFQNIVDFEPRRPGRCRCDRALSRAIRRRACTFNFNYDVAHSPEIRPAPIAPDGATAVPRSRACTRLPEPRFDAGGRCGEAESRHTPRRDETLRSVRPERRLGWGAQPELTLRRPLGAARGFDASEWDGFSFWIEKTVAPRASAFDCATGGRSLHGRDAKLDGSVGRPGALVRRESDPATDRELLVWRIPDTEKCDAFGVAVTLTDEWTLHRRVVSSPCRQKGFGVPSPLGQSRPRSIARLQFLMSAGDWDLWIDDVAFFASPRNDGASGELAPPGWRCPLGCSGCVRDGEALPPDARLAKEARARAARVGWNECREGPAPARHRPLPGAASCGRATAS